MGGGNSHSGGGGGGGQRGRLRQPESLAKKMFDGRKSSEAKANQEGMWKQFQQRYWGAVDDDGGVVPDSVWDAGGVGDSLAEEGTYYLLVYKDGSWVSIHDGFDVNYSDNPRNDYELASLSLREKPVYIYTEDGYGIADSLVFSYGEAYLPSGYQGKATIDLGGNAVDHYNDTHSNRYETEYMEAVSGLFGGNSAGGKRHRKRGT